MTDGKAVWAGEGGENSQDSTKYRADSCGSICTVHNEIGRELVSAGKVFRDTRVRSSMGRLDGSYAQYGAASAQIHDRDSGVRRDRMTV